MSTDRPSITLRLTGSQARSLLEALHIAKARRQEQYRHGEERDSKNTRQRTIRQMIIDYDHLIDIINTKIQ